ncbi:MAG TPA: creatininase family protein [Thermodesulfobacteriota bacterium]
MPAWYELSSMTWPEFKAAQRDIRVALQPVGATEQHGPNMTFQTDIRIAHEMARRLAATIHPLAVVLPPLPLGISYHHMGFPGTLTVSEQTFHAVLMDVAASVKQHGITKICFVNGHFGNVAALGTLVTRLRYEMGMTAAALFYFTQASDVMAKHAKTPRWGHACEIEASVGLAVAPDLVRTEALAPGEMLDLPWRHAGNQVPFAAQVAFAFHEMTRNGAFGDARLATAEAGEAIVAAAIERGATFLRDFVGAAPEPRP